MRRLLTFAMAMLLAVPAMGAEKAMSVEQAMKAATDARSLSLAHKSTLLAEAGDADGLARHMAEMKTDPELADAARERLLHDSAMAAARLHPDDALEAEVRALASYESRTLVWTDEHGYRETRPLYDFAATSRHVRRIWAEERSRSVTARAIAASDVAIVERYATAPAAERAGAVAAFRDASADRLAVFQPALMDALDRGIAVDGLAAVAADKLRDAALMEKVLSAGAADTARRAIEAIRSPDWAGEASRLLEIAAGRQDIASAAFLALGRQAATDPGAVEFLFQALGGPSGPSAAAALARLDDPEIVNRLADSLRSAGDDTTRRHALLGLRLADSPIATQALAVFVRDPGSPPELVAEVPPWLLD